MSLLLIDQKQSFKKKGQPRGMRAMHLAPHTGEKSQLALYVIFIPLTFSNYINIDLKYGENTLFL